MSDRVILISFWLGPIHKLFKSGVHFAVRAYKVDIKFSWVHLFPDGPSQFQMAHLKS